MDFVGFISGHGEWEDDTKTRCRILWRKPEQLAADIYTWAEANGYINSVCTVYELHSGELGYYLLYACRSLFQNHQCFTIPSSLCYEIITFISMRLVFRRGCQRNVL
jgi:hypothetical protein